VHHIVVSEILVTVDALHALSQLSSEPLGRRQVEIADRIVIAKLDEAKASDLGKLLATLAVLNPGAEMSGSIKGTASQFPSFSRAEAGDLVDLWANADLPQIFPSKLVISEKVDWTAFCVWLSARGHDVLRVKGVVTTPAGRLLVQTVRKIVQSPEILPEQTDGQARDDNTIVVIGRGYRAEELVRSLDHFASRRRN
jgi:G3E family GTPase